MTSIYHQCPACDATIESRLTLAGFTTACPACGAEGVLVPEESTVAPSPSAAGEPVRDVAENHPIRRCFLCQQERPGVPRCLTLALVYDRGPFVVKRWVNARCFCCDACEALWRWHYLKRFVFTMSIAVVVSGAVAVLVFFWQDIPRDSLLRSPWVWGPLGVVLVLAAIVGVFWDAVRVGRMIDPESRRTLQTLIGARLFQLRIRDRVPLGEQAVDLN